MPSKLKALAQKAKTALSSPTAKKLALGVAGVATAGALAYGGYKAYKALKGGSKSRMTLAKVRNKRRIWQEKVKLERAKKSYERVMSQ